MSLQLAAQHLAAQGRGPDKQLVHMSPREVAGLQALAMSHGGSLSINPETGLPEAGFLDNLLPTIIGAGLMFATGGTAAPLVAGISNPALIGLGIGGLETLRTGDLSKGIMAGLGAYGGAGLSAGLAGGMTVSNPNAAAIAAEQAAAPAAQMGVTGAGNVPFQFGLSDPSIGLAEQAEIARAAGTAYPTLPPPTQYVNPFAGQPNLADYAYGPEVQSGLIEQEAQNRSVAELSERLGGARIAPGQVPRINTIQALGGDEAINAMYGQYPPPLTVSAPASVPAIPAVAPSPAFDMGSHVEGFGTPVDFLSGMSDVSAVEGPGVAGAGLPTRSSTFASRLSAMPGKDLAKYGLAAAAPVLLAPPEVKAPAADTEQYRYAYTPGRVEYPERGYAGAPTGERMYFQPQYTRLAAGGPVEAMSTANVYDMQNARGGVSDMGVDMSTGMQRMARGGISDLGDYSDGGRLLKGPGDGVSDSIPAVIGRKRPARLADGEFVLPARIVSEIGNGSTEAGARKLYAMMDRVQRARGKTTGKGKVAKNTRAEKYLPA